jgi:hypothetical protein
LVPYEARGALTLLEALGTQIKAALSAQKQIPHALDAVAAADTAGSVCVHDSPERDRRNAPPQESLERRKA